MNVYDVCIFSMNYDIDDYVCLDLWHIYVLRKKSD